MRAIDVADDVVADVADVRVPGRVREHLEAVELRPRRVFRRPRRRASSRPALLPLLLDGLGFVVRHDLDRRGSPRRTPHRCRSRGPMPHCAPAFATAPAGRRSFSGGRPAGARRTPGPSFGWLTRARIVGHSRRTDLKIITHANTAIGRSARHSAPVRHGWPTHQEACERVRRIVECRERRLEALAERLQVVTALGDQRDPRSSRPGVQRPNNRGVSVGGHAHRRERVTLVRVEAGRQSPAPARTARAPGARWSCTRARSRRRQPLPRAAR